MGTRTATIVIFVAFATENSLATREGWSVGNVHCITSIGQAG